MDRSRPHHDGRHARARCPASISVHHARAMPGQHHPGRQHARTDPERPISASNPCTLAPQLMPHEHHDGIARGRAAARNTHATIPARSGEVA